MFFFSASLPMSLTDVKTLNESNFEDWKESLELYLALTDMDLSLRVEKPNELTPNSSTADRIFYEKWVHSNRVCLMVMKYTMEKHIRHSIGEEADNAKAFLEAIGEHFKKLDKPLKSLYLSLLLKTKYDGVSGIREYIMKLIQYYEKLKSLKVEMGERFIVWHIMNSLPSQFDILKSCYDNQKEEWSVSEMIAIVTLEEESMKMGSTHSAHIVSHTSGSEDDRKPQFGSSTWNEKKDHSEEKDNKYDHHLGARKKFFKGT